MSKIGVALITYGRFERARAVVGRLIEHTPSPIELVIADDGSADGTAEWMDRIGLRVIGRENRGVCWNKNRGLFALLALGCDSILLLEDDIFPTVDGWEKDWQAATQAFDHLAFAHDKIAPQILSGSGTAEDPYVNYKATAQCTAVSAKALMKAGFLDTRFKGYGVGHAEWTTRIKRLGMGFRWATLADGRRARANLYIKGGLVAEDAPSYRDKATVAANSQLFKDIKGEPPFRWPWSNPVERDQFLEEQRAAGIDVEVVLKQFAHREAQTPLAEAGA